MHRLPVGFTLLVLSILFRPAIAQTRLIFPDLQQKSDVSLGYAVSNPNGEPAQATFSAYGLGGDLVAGDGITNPVTLDLAPHGQLARFPGPIFGFPADLDVDGWMEVTSDSDEIKGFFLTLEDGLERVDGADAFETTASSFFLLFPPGIAFDQSILHVINPNDAPTDVTITLMTAQGGTMEEQTENVATHGKLQSVLTDLLVSIAPLGVGPGTYLRVESDAEIAAYLLSRIGDSVAGLNGMVPLVAPTVLSPHLAVSPLITTALQIASASNLFQRLTLTARNDQGELLEGASNNPREITLPSGQLFEADMEEFFGLSEGDTHSGWIEIVSAINGRNVEVAGSISFGARDGTAFTAALPLQTVAKLVNLFSHVAHGVFGSIEWFTGLAVLNATDLDANIAITVRDPAGNVTQSGGVQLKAGERFARTMPVLLPGFQRQAGGSIQLSSNVAVFAFTFFGMADLSLLAAIPTQPFNDIEVLDGTGALNGTIRGGVLRIPAGTTFNPTGPIELIGESSVIVDGDIVSAFGVSIQSDGDVILNGRVDTSVEPAPAQRALRSRSRIDPTGVLAAAPSIGIDAGGTLFLQGSSVEDPDDPELEPHVRSGASANIRWEADRIIIGGNVFLSKAGNGSNIAMGNEVETSVVHGAPGGSIELRTRNLEKLNPSEELTMRMEAGNGGGLAQGQADPFVGNNGMSFGSNGSDGGGVTIGVDGQVGIDRLSVEVGLGWKGQGAEAGENCCGDSEAGGGRGGHGGSFSITTESDEVQSVQIIAKVKTGRVGGDATARPRNGESGDNPMPGSNGTAIAGPGGDNSKVTVGPATSFPNVAIEVGPTMPLTKPHGGNAVVEGQRTFLPTGPPPIPPSPGPPGAKGGDSTNVENDGAIGGEIIVEGGKGGSSMGLKDDAGIDLSGDDGTATANNVANGGNGAPCKPLPNTPGGNGGMGGTLVRASGRIIFIVTSFNGGNAGIGNSPGTPGLEGPSMVDKDLLFLDGKSFMPGAMATAGCPIPPASTSPLNVFAGYLFHSDDCILLAGDDPICQLTLTIPFGNLLSMAVTLNDFSAILKFQSLEDGHIEEFSLGSPTGDILVPVEEEISLEAGLYAVLVCIFDEEGSIYDELLIDFVDLREGNQMVTLDLTQATPLGARELFNVSGTLTGNFPYFRLFMEDGPGRISASAALSSPNSLSANVLGTSPLGGGSFTYNSNVPAGNYELTAFGLGSGNSIRLIDPGLLNVSSGPVVRNIVLPDVFNVTGEVSAESGEPLPDYRAIFFRDTVVDSQSGNNGYSLFVPNGSYEVQVTRQPKRDGFTAGNFLTFDQATVQGDTAIDFVAPDMPELIPLRLLFVDPLGNPIDNIILDVTSTSLDVGPPGAVYQPRFTRPDETGMTTGHVIPGEYTLSGKIPLQ